MWPLIWITAAVFDVIEEALRYGFTSGNVRRSTDPYEDNIIVGTRRAYEHEVVWCFPVEGELRPVGSARMISLQVTTVLSGF